MPQSAVPDLILCFAIFDALVAMESHHFTKFIQASFVKEAVPHYFGLLALITLILWFFAVMDLERQLLESHKQPRSLLNLRTITLLFVSLLLASAVIIFSVFPFTYRM